MATAREFHHIPHTNSQLLSEKMQQALASLALEGIKLSSKALEDIHKLDAGQMSKKDFLKKVIQRAKS